MCSTLVSTRAAFHAAWDLLVREGVPRGLHLSWDKSFVSWAGGDTGVDPLGREVPGVGVGVGVVGFKLLGTLKGEQAFKREVLENRVGGIKTRHGQSRTGMTVITIISLVYQ